MKIINVAPLPDYKLNITFDDGVFGSIDLKSFVNGGIFSILKDTKIFNTAYTTGYSVAWNEELEIDALAIYAEITNKPFDEILHPDIKYATN